MSAFRADEKWEKEHPLQAAKKGKVPAQTIKAIVCLYAGDPGTGPTYATQADFKYVAGK